MSTELKDGVARNSGTGALLRTFYAANTLVGSGPPSSGTTGDGIVTGTQERVALYLDEDTGSLFTNEGTGPSPYWTPLPYDQPALFGVNTDFRDGAGKAIADTAAAAVLAGSGLRIFGQGVEVNGDAGLVVGSGIEGGRVGVLHVTDEVSHLTALGMLAGTMQPDQHKGLVIDVEYTDVDDILTSSVFCGFVGTAADALDPVVTGATTVATLVQDDLAGLYSDSSMTDADAWFGVHNKSDAAATMTAGDTGPTNRAAAGTYQRLRVEIDVAGNMRAFVNKAQVYYQAVALDVDEEVSPVFYIENATTVTRTANIKRIAMWASR
jgi:hypothetical protein